MKPPKRIELSREKAALDRSQAQRAKTADNPYVHCLDIVKAARFNIAHGTDPKEALAGAESAIQKAYELSREGAALDRSQAPTTAEGRAK